MVASHSRRTVPSFVVFAFVATAAVSFVAGERVGARHAGLHASAPAPASTREDAPTAGVYRLTDLAGGDAGDASGIGADCNTNLR
jgi:hypothetical protein